MVRSFVLPHQSLDIADNLTGADDLLLGESKPWFTGDFFGDQVDEEKTHEPGPDEFLLYPPRVLGYSTREKVWGQFSVDKTSDVPEPSMSLFREKLQLDEDYKNMIQALVEEHGARGDQSNPDKVKIKDVVEDKGKGLVLLLHGPPGVGKTVSSQTWFSVQQILTNCSSRQKRLQNTHASHFSLSASRKLASTLQKQNAIWSRCSI